MKKTALAPLALLAISTISSTALAGPIYDIDEYGLVMSKRNQIQVLPFLQVNEGYGFSSKTKWKSLDDSTGFESRSKSEGNFAYNIQLGINGAIGNGYSIDIALYHAYLGSTKIEYQENVSVTDPTSGDVSTQKVNAASVKMPVKGYGLKTAFNIPLTEKSDFSVLLGAGFMSTKADFKDLKSGLTDSVKMDGGQLSIGVGYLYRFNDTIAWNINLEHYFLATGTEAKTTWDGVNTGIRFSFF